MKIQNGVLVRVVNADIIGGVFNIPDSVTSIGDYAFRDCTSLESINIPDSVTSIGYCAFYGCTGLKSIVIPDSVESIGKRAFRDCTGLKSIVIPDSVKWIGNFAFKNCTNLSSHNINKSDIIDLAISLLPVHDGLCSCLDEATRTMSIKTHTAISVQSIFPNFKQEIAIEKFGGRDEGYWWSCSDKESRLKFLEYLRNN